MSYQPPQPLVHFSADLFRKCHSEWHVSNMWASTHSKVLKFNKKELYETFKYSNIQIFEVAATSFNKISTDSKLLVSKFYCWKSMTIVDYDRMESFQRIGRITAQTRETI